MRNFSKITLTSKGLKAARERLEQEMATFDSKTKPECFLDKSRKEVLSAYFSGAAEERFAVAYYVLSSPKYVSLNAKAAKELQGLFAGCETAAKLAEDYSHCEEAFKNNFIRLALEHPSALCLFCADLCYDFLQRFQNEYKIDINREDLVKKRFKQDFKFCQFERILTPALAQSFLKFCLLHVKRLSQVVNGEVGCFDLERSLGTFTETASFKDMQRLCQVQVSKAPKP